VVTAILQAKGLRAITVAWLVLCAITIASWWLSPAHSAAPAVPSMPITLAVIALGIVKCRLVIRCYMEVNTAPRWLRLATDAWLIVFWFGVLTIYLF
jgi:hypothetical protein